jgi:hypothetical protein
MSGIDLRTEWLSQLDRAAASVGAVGDKYTTQGFLPWVEHLASKGMRIDGIDFDLSSRPVLREIYASMPSTIAEAQRATIVLMKSAQMGASVLGFLHALYMAVAWEPVVIGMFLPDQATALDISQRRFLRVIRAVPDLHRRLTTRVLPDGSVVNVGEQNVLTRILGESHLLFGWTSSATSTESRAMDSEIVDEVQQISLEELDRIYERMSASRVRFRFMLSTANMPDNDIAKWFSYGTMKSWHSACSACGEETDLAQHFPACVAYNTGQYPDAPLLDYLYCCPSCAAWIRDPQVGSFQAANPSAKIESFHISQIVSSTITPRDLIEAWNRAITGDQRKSFYNRKLGLPYIDKEQLPVSMADCLACAEEGQKLGLVWETSSSSGDVYLGCDQMAGWCAIIIKKRLPDGRQAVIHCEAIFAIDSDPFVRVDELMRQYNVSIAVVEQLPNANDARRFCARWTGRAYMVSAYTGPGSDMITWGDAPGVRNDLKTAAEDRSRYSVGVQQYKMMQSALFRIRNKFCLFPSAELEQTVLDQGEWKRINLVRDWVFMHYTKTGLVVEQDEFTRTPKPKVIKVGGVDGHFAFATMLCDVGWTRVHGASQFIMPQGLAGYDPPKTEVAQQMERDMPGLPRHVLAMVDDQPQSVCGRCVNASADGRQCTLRLLSITPTMPSCEIFDPIPR